MCVNRSIDHTWHEYASGSHCNDCNASKIVSSGGAQQHKGTSIDDFEECVNSSGCPKQSS
eukprot:8752912-Prorocentrum_lima.AAC.1